MTDGRRKIYSPVAYMRGVSGSSECMYSLSTVVSTSITQELRKWTEIVKIQPLVVDCRPSRVQLGAGLYVLIPVHFVYIEIYPEGVALLDGYGGIDVKSLCCFPLGLVSEKLSQSQTSIRT